MSNEFRVIAPVFPVRDVSQAMEHYRALGFAVKPYGDPSGELVYAFASRDRVEIHLARTPNLDSARNTSACYLYVADANALHAAWKALPGRTTDPQDTPYHLREFAHVDPDGNLLRVGSELD
jgi:hypothetical protein